jgi:hypothetical protein
MVFYESDCPANCLELQQRFPAVETDVAFFLEIILEELKPFLYG